jgi:hypothetical protein
MTSEETPEWLALLDRAMARFGPVRPNFPAAPPAPPGTPAPWGELPASLADDLDDWFAWAARIAPRTPQHAVADLPLGLPLPRANAIQRSLELSEIAALVAPEDPSSFWRSSWVPLTGDLDLSFVLDTDDPDFAVLEWLLEDGQQRLAGYGLRSLPEITAALIESGVIEKQDTGSPWRRGAGEIPASVDPEHPLLRGRYF